MGEMNEGLHITFIRNEIEDALSQMVPLKFPIHDGLGAIFYQSYWEKIKQEVSIGVLNFLNGGTFLITLTLL